MRVALAIGLGLLLAANGFLMLADPAQWYAIVPGVPETGPFNPHFVRDIGAAYVVTVVAIAWLARSSGRARRGAVPHSARARSRRRRDHRAAPHGTRPQRPRHRVRAGRDRSLACLVVHSYLKEKSHAELADETSPRRLRT